MATKSLCIFGTYAKNSVLKNTFVLYRVDRHDYSMWPPYFAKPIFIKEDQKQVLETEEGKSLHHIPVRAALADQSCSVFYDPTVKYFINLVMRHGKKQLARELVEKTFENIKRFQIEKYHKAKTQEEKDSIILDPRTVFFKAVENTTPLLGLTKIKRGGVTYQVPIPISDHYARFNAMRWLIDSGKEKDRTIRFHRQLAYEMIEASKNQGRAVKRKTDLHRQCEANRAYAHYRWS